MWVSIIPESVVNVNFISNNKLNMITGVLYSQFSIYELQDLYNDYDRFYNIKKHTITEDLKYKKTEYLIPVEMAYLEKVGTMKDYEKITYFEYNSEAYFRRGDALDKAFRDKYGYDRVFADKNEYKEIENEVVEKTIKFEKIRDGIIE